MSTLSVALHFEKVSSLCCAGVHASLSLPYLTFAFRSTSPSSVTTSLDASSQNIKHVKNQCVTKQTNDGLGTYCSKSWTVAGISDRCYWSICFLGLMLHIAPSPLQPSCEGCLCCHIRKADWQLLQIPVLYCYKQLQKMQESFEQYSWPSEKKKRAVLGASCAGHFLVRHTLWCSASAASTRGSTCCHSVAASTEAHCLFSTQNRCWLAG